jgi:hypothetical protein
MNAPKDGPQRGTIRPADLRAVLARFPFDRAAIRQPISSDPVIVVPPAVLARYNARVLDPANAVKVTKQPAVRSTVYIADKLLVSGAASDEGRDQLTRAAESKFLTVQPPLAHTDRRNTFVAAAREAGRTDAEKSFPQLVHLEPMDGVAVVPDAWEVLQAFRAAVGPGSPDQQHVGLDHLLTATRYTHGSPFGGGPQAWGTQSAVASASYGVAGWGGRQPVNWIGPAPARNPDFKGRRPVVAVLDTGVGEHDWFAEGVARNQTWGNAVLGLTDPATDPESVGVIDDPLEGILDPDAGHGTFIAGLIRQQCPDADILSIRVMPSDGAVPEHVLLDALHLLAIRQQWAQRTGNTAGIVDVVSLSLGYYHEQPEDVDFDPLLLEPIRALGRSGVAVVVAAGNDSTHRPMYPAAFSPHRGGRIAEPEADCVPVTGVGALNPDGTTALFSNAGPWVTWREPGAALVSTFPKTFDGSAQPDFEFPDGEEIRATIDPDGFESGFGVWSGTSFAAPVLAGKLAQTLLESGCDDVDQHAMLERGWAAVKSRVGTERP